MRIKGEHIEISIDILGMWAWYHLLVQYEQENYGSHKLWPAQGQNQFIE